MKREYLRQTAEWRLSVVTNLAGLRAMDKRFITLELEDGAFSISETFEVERFTFDPSSMRCSMDLISVGPEIDEWDAASEEGAASSGLDFAMLGDPFSKTGTALNPLTELGGEIGNTAVVFVGVGSSSVIPATPSGWTEIGRVGVTSTLSMAAFYRVLDGSEGSTTFLGASGIIIGQLIDGAPSPTTSGFQSQITTAFPSEQTQPADTTPYAVFAFGLANINNGATTWVYFGGTGGNPGPDVSIAQASASLSGVMHGLIFTSDAIPSAIFAGYFADVGTNGLVTFILRPGS